MGFLSVYTSVSIDPLSVLVNLMSMNASCPSFSFSIENVMSVVLLIVCNKFSMWCVLVMDIRSSTLRSQSFTLLFFARAWRSKSCITASARKQERGEPMGVPEV